jgi:hypothetical protein
MVDHYPLSINAQHLQRLASDQAVNLFRQLLMLEAARIGISKTLVNVPSAITVSDGGVDADVSGVNLTARDGLIKPGLTRYQIKTGVFSLTNRSNRLSILCKPAQRGKPRELNTRVESCLAQGGTLVVVLFGWDGPERNDNAIASALQADLETIDARYSNASIEVLRPNQLVGLLLPFPSLRLSLLGGTDAHFMTLAGWSSLSDMRTRWTSGSEQQSFLSSIQLALRTADAPTHIRVTGEPGLGKTRATLEALRADDLAPAVLYCATPKGVLQSNLITQILLRDQDLLTVLVVDECDPASKAELWNALESVSPQVRLITIYSEPDPARGPDAQLSPSPLAEQQIIEIFSRYGVPEMNARRFVQFCDGSPRAAHILGQNLRDNPEELLRPLDTVQVWHRWIAGPDMISSDTFDKRLRVLLWLSLFKRFGYGSPFDHEAKLIARKIEIEERISWREFQTIVKGLRERKILQGDTTLYITPKLLHVWLWNEWWERYGKAERFDLSEFRIVDPTVEPQAELTPQMVEWFREMFRYSVTAGTSKVVEGLLGPGGPFTVEYLATGEGSRFFMTLVETAPQMALRRLQKTIGRLNHEQLLSFRTGRRSCVHALEQIAVWRECFAGSARLLLALGSAENETWTNNAGGVFADLFSPARGEGAPTEASAEERFPVLRQAFHADTPETRRLGIAAAKRALQTSNFVRMSGDTLGLVRQPKRWQPETWAEVFDAYRRVWRLLLDTVDRLPADEQQEVVALLLERADNLTLIDNLADMVIDGVEELAKKPFVPGKAIMNAIAIIQQYATGHMSERAAARWESLRSRLEGASYHSRLERYVGLDLLVDKYESGGRDRVDKAGPKIEALADEAIQNPNLLGPELAWLATDEAQNGYRFGYELGMRDQGHELLSDLLGAHHHDRPNKSGFFLSGYLRALREQDAELWESTLDGMVSVPQLATLIPELTWRSEGLTDRAANRVLDLIQHGLVPVDNLRFFVYGSSLSQLSEQSFRAWIEMLLARPEERAAIIALELADAFYLHRSAAREIPWELVYRVLSHASFFECALESGFDTMTDHYWGELGKRLVVEQPSLGLRLAARMVEHFGDSRTIIGRFHASSLEVLSEIAKSHPGDVWNLVTPLLGPPVDARAYELVQWLSGGISFGASEPVAIEFFAPEIIWIWVDRDVDQRASYVADLVPKALFHREGTTCYLREVLCRYGDRPEVRNAATVTYLSGGWTGPASLHYEAEKADLVRFRGEETDQRVLDWVDDTIELLDRYIANERAREEREDFR